MASPLIQADQTGLCDFSALDKLQQAVFTACMISCELVAFSLQVLLHFTEKFWESSALFGGCPEASPPVLFQCLETVCKSPVLAATFLDPPREGPEDIHPHGQEHLQVSLVFAWPSGHPAAAVGFLTVHRWTCPMHGLFQQKCCLWRFACAWLHGALLVPGITCKSALMM